MTMEGIAGIGHNEPPPDLRSGELLRAELPDRHADLIRRRDELLAMAADFKADHPERIDNDEESGILAGIIAQINAAAKICEKQREGVKAPYLEGSRIVDGFFTGTIKSKLDEAAKGLNAMQTAFQRAKAEKARREAEEAERKARAEEDARRREAERAEREKRQAEAAAKRAQDDQERAEAEKRRQEAEAKAKAAREEQDRAAAERQQQQKVATSSAADLSRVRGDFAMASLRTTWKFRVVDLAKVPPHYLQINSAAVNAAIRGKDGLRDIPGLDIYAEQEAVNR